MTDKVQRIRERVEVMRNAYKEDQNRGMRPSGMDAEARGAQRAMTRLLDWIDRESDDD